MTRTVTATGAGFAFVRPYRGGDVVAERNTLIALDGDTEIRTPHDHCLLVMPSLRTMPGHTAVRLARFVEGSQPHGAACKLARKGLCSTRCAQSGHPRRSVAEAESGGRNERVQYGAGSE